MNNNSSINTNEKILVLLSLIAITYSIFGLFTDTVSTGLYLGTIILSTIILFLSFNILLLTRITKKHK